jgi:hypothetical protein
VPALLAVTLTGKRKCLLDQLAVVGLAGAQVLFDHSKQITQQTALELGQIRKDRLIARTVCGGGVFWLILLCGWAAGARGRFLLGGAHPPTSILRPTFA